MRLGDICDIINGNAFKSERYVDSGVRIIRIANVQKGYIDDSSPVFYPIDSIECEKYKLYENDLLISLTGNVGRVALLKKEHLPAALNQRVACLRIKDENQWNKSFLFNFLNSDYFENKCNESANGVAQKNMSTEWLKDYEIPCLPIDKQLQIAKEIDALAETIFFRKEQLSTLNQTIRSRFLEMFGDPNINPMGWDKVPLSECLINIENGRSFVCDTAKRTGEKPAVLKLGAVTYGYYQANENKAMFEESQFVASAEVHKGDLLFTRKNTPELVGMSAYVYDTPPKLMMPDLIFRLNTKPNCHKMFLWKLINLDLFRPNISALSSGSAKSMSNISKERLMGLEIILPPIELQEQFADFVTQVDEAKKAVQESLDNLEILKKSLMQKYFG